VNDSTGVVKFKENALVVFGVARDFFTGSTCLA
jgi:hypothetical protein